MSWIQRLFRRDRLYDDLSQEMQSHLEERTEQLIAQGMPPAEAARAARRAFGNRTLIAERSREVWTWPTLASILADIRLAIRQLRRSPGFAVAAILTLALAIGANAVVFSLMNAFILRPLDVPRAESLYALWRPADADAHLSYPDYLDLRDRNHSFESLAAYNIEQVGLDTGSDPSQSWLYETSGNYFDSLAIQPYLGRFFHPADEHGPGSAPYMVLSYDFWHTRFQNDPGVLGRVVQINKHPFTILGVTPPGFHGTLLFFNPDFFTPIVNHTQYADNDLQSRSDRWVFMTLGHLKPGVTQAQAAADLTAIGHDLERTYPKDDAKMTFTLARPSLYGDYLGRPVRAFLAGLMLLSGLILLAACANLGSLFAARAADRSREVALRLALGSSRTRILRGLFTEAILIALAGGAAGLAGSIVLLRALSAWHPFPRWPVHLSVNPDANVYAMALLLALVSGFLFGAVPVRQVLHTNPYEVVKSGSNPRPGRRISLRDCLLVLQIAICAVLVTSSMVAVRGLAHSLHNNFGFDLRSTMVVSTDLSMAGYTGDRVPPMQKRMIEAIQAIPGVQSVGLADTLPLGDGSNDVIVFPDTASDLKPANATADATLFNISPEYFQAAGTTILSGRAFTWHDDKSSPRVAVINRELARRLFGSIPKAMGGFFKLRDGARIQVVGIAEDGKYASLTEDPVPAMFFPILQSPSTSSLLVVRTTGEPQAIAEPIRATLRKLDSALPVYLQTRSNGLGAVLFGPRMATLSLGILGVMGAVLSITGIFGMAAYSVGRRLRELGIRMALGAKRTEVLHAALGRAFKLLAMGSAAGLLLGILASRVIASIVSQATPRDPIVLSAVVLAMSLIGLLATWIPAQRALSVNPSILLRED
jgi:predicted permease